MDTYLYAQHKIWILKEAYKFFVGNYQLRFGSTLRDHINYVCFDSLENKGETIDELYAACYYMWFYLYQCYGLPLTSDRLATIEKLIYYLENEIKFHSGLQEECLEDDINELKQIKKQLVDENRKKLLDFIAEMYTMDNRLRLKGSPTYHRYGKINDNANWQAAKIILLDTSSIAQKFVCLATFCKICMYGEIIIDNEVKEFLKKFLSTVHVEELVANFITTNDINLKDYIVFLKRSMDFSPSMSKDEFLNLLEQKRIPYNAGNYVDRIEIHNIHISINATSSNDIKIPSWDIKLNDNGNCYTIARFDNRPDAYTYFLKKYV